MAKKIKRSRSSKIAIAAMYGEEPSFADFETLSEEDRESVYGKAMYWYHGVYSNNESKTFLIEYVKKNRKKDLSAVKASEFSSAWGNIANAICNGYKSESLITKLDSHIDKLVAQGKELLVETKKVQAIVNKVPVLSIQERIRLQVNTYLGEIENEVDEFIASDCKKSDFNLYKWLQKNEVKGVHAGHIKTFYVDVLDEFQQVLDGNDPDLLEGYAFLSKPQKKKLVEFVGGFVSDAEAWIGVAKTQRKPRKKKTQSVQAKVSRVKYKTSDSEYKISSVDPEKMIDASQVWLFNTKDRFLYRYVSTRGIVIKGTTLLDWDESRSFKKKVRKPENILPDVVKGGKIKLRKLMDEINAKEGKVTGRINSDMIILRVI